MKIVLFLFLLSGVLFSQQYDNYSAFESTNRKFYEGLTNVLEWYDIPVSAAYYYSAYFRNSGMGDFINLGPTHFEREFADKNGVHGNFSPGSIDKDIIPDIIFAGSLTATYVTGLLSKNSVSEKSFRRVFLLRKSLIYTYTLTEWVKNVVKRERPDGSDNRSFFSGHTSTTFSAATYIFLATNDLYDSWSLTKNDETLNMLFKSGTFAVCYGWASYVGYSRIRDKKHYLTDVLTGATVGSLISYFIYDYYMESDDMPGMIELIPGRESVNLSLKVNF